MCIGDHNLTTQASTPSTATLTNIELIEEDGMLSLVETDNTHIIIYPEAVQWNPPRGRLPPSTMFCVSLTEVTCVFT